MILAVVGGDDGRRSTLAFNLGWELDAVVVDASLELADLSVLRGPDLHDVLAERATPVEAVREAGPVTLLPCGRSLAGGEDPGALGRVLDAVVAEYGCVVVDCPTGPERAGRVLPVATAGVVVTAARVDDIRGETLARQLDTPLARVALVHAGTDPPCEDVGWALGAPVVRLPESDRLAAAMDSGLPVGMVAPDGPAAAAVARLAAGVHRSRRS